MFTVKWIADNGAEMLYCARDVSFTPANTIAPGALVTVGANDPPRMVEMRDLGKPCVSFYIVGQRVEVDGVAFPGAGDSHCVLDSGRVYVMNSFGKTVADYVLSTKEFPHGLAPRQAA